MKRHFNTATFSAFFFREIHAALLTRFIYVFCAVALLAGLVPLMSDPGVENDSTAAYTLLQASLFLVPLFAMLIGVGAAQSDHEEEPFLMTQPAGRGVRVLAKFSALWLIVSFAALLLVVPEAIRTGIVGPLVFLWLHALGAGGVFAAIGLAIGFSTNDRVKAHMLGLCAWFVFLAGFDLLALAAAQMTALQKMPQTWLVLLMLNPLDALRVSALLTLDRIPFDPASAPPLGRWWLGHLVLWFAILSAGWITLALAWSRFRLERKEF